MSGPVSASTLMRTRHNVRARSHAGDLVLGSVPQRLSCPIRMSWSLVWASPDAGVAAALRAPHLPRRLEQVHTQLLRRILSDLIVPAADQMHGAYGAHLRSVSPWLEHISVSLDTMRRHAVHAPWDTSAILPALMRADHAVYPPSGFPLQWPHAERSPSLVSDDLPVLSSDATCILSPHRSARGRSSPRAPSSDDVRDTPCASPR